MRIVFVALFLILSINVYSQKRIYIDENNKVIKEEPFLRRWRDKDNLLSRWDYFNADGKRFQKLYKNLYNLYDVNYDSIVKQINKIIPGQNIGNKTIIIEFVYYNDLCSDYTFDYTKTSKDRLKKSESYYND